MLTHWHRDHPENVDTGVRIKWDKTPPPPPKTAWLILCRYDDRYFSHPQESVAYTQLRRHIKESHPHYDKTKSWEVPINTYNIWRSTRTEPAIFKDWFKKHQAQILKIVEYAHRAGNK
jgi:hypothetical protein